jgi:hypothetical protein
MGKKYICLLADIYGFGAVAKSDPEGALKNLKEFQDRIVNLIRTDERTFPDRNFVWRVFSDTIFLALDLTKDATRRFEGFILLAERLYSISLDSDLPLRGCLTFGEAFIDGNSLVGMPLIVAAQYEKIMTIPCLMFPSSTVKEIQESKLLNSADILKLLGPNCRLLLQDSLLSFHPMVQSNRKKVKEYAKEKFEFYKDQPSLLKPAASWYRLYDLLERPQ